MSLGLIFFIGLIASISTCIASVGALIVALSINSPDGKGRLRIQVLFHLGRLVSFFLLGGLIGILGASFTFSSVVVSILGIIVTLVMLLLGLRLLDVNWAKKILPSLPKYFAEKIRVASQSGNRLAPFMVGALTFLLPCGFTQSMQIYTLTQTGFWNGALTMFVFALGTLPVLAFLSFGSDRLIHSHYSKKFLKIVGVIIVLVSLLNLAGYFGFSFKNVIPRNVPNTSSPILMEDGKQIIEISTRQGYRPSQKRAPANVETVLRFKTDNAFDCSLAVKIPDLGIYQFLPTSGITDINIGVPKPGDLKISCSMGMYSTKLNFY